MINKGEKVVIIVIKSFYYVNKKKIKVYQV